MSTYLYDDALLEKIKKWTSGLSSMHIYGPNDTERLYETIAQSTDDEPIKLPIVCLRRKGGFEILNPNRVPLQCNGVLVHAENGKSIKLNAIPINIEYQLDVYCKLYKEADSYIREFIFNFLNYPNMKIKIPYRDLNYIHSATVRISNNVEDNSDIPERLNFGQFTRMSLNVNIDDAYLWDVSEKNIKTISDADIEIVEGV